MNKSEEVLRLNIQRLSNEIIEIDEQLINVPSDGVLKNKRKEIFKNLKENEQELEKLEAEDKSKEAFKESIKQQNNSTEQSKIEDNLETEPPQKEAEIKRLLLEMTLEKLVSTLNKELSGNGHSDIKDFSNPPVGKSYAFWYCMNQASAYHEIWVKIGEIEFYSYIDGLRSMSDLLTERTEMIRELIPNGDFNTLSNRIETLEMYQSRMEYELINLPNSSVTMRYLKSKLRGYVQAIENELKDIAERAAQYNQN